MIVDYGLGNLRSVAGAVERLGHAPVISGDPGQIAQADRLILPGVGSFGDGMANLRRLGLVEALTEAVLQRKTPTLGICLGAQLMAREGEEFGHHDGLGWISASVVRLDPADKALRVPHVGWNELQPTRPCLLWEGIPREALFYYVHSYHIRCDRPELVVGECDYGGRMTAAFQRGNIFGTQFHPEKSQLHGLAVLRNFLERS